jgi:hypothetical protein
LEARFKVRILAGQSDQEANVVRLLFSFPEG